MNYLENCLGIRHTVRDALKYLEEKAFKVIMVVDPDYKLLGTVTDGDIRRGFLCGASLDSPLSEVMNASPKFMPSNLDRASIRDHMQARTLRYMPLVDEAGRVVGLETIDPLLLHKKRDNWVILMAGGLGTRLHPHTETCPKPMLKIGGRPVLEIILDRFISHGFYRFYISVNYLASMVMDYFGDGKDFGVEIRYLHEQKRLGTAGSMSLIPESPEEPVIVMNGDVLTLVDFESLLNFHEEHQSEATMGVREYDYQIPYGVVSTDKHHISTIREKPIERYYVNSGIYVLNPEILEMVPPNQFFDMPDLYRMALEEKRAVMAFPIREYWLDIGNVEDLERAHRDVAEDLAISRYLLKKEL